MFTRARNYSTCWIFWAHGTRDKNRRTWHRTLEETAYANSHEWRSAQLIALVCAGLNRSHQSPSDQSLSNCHGKLDKHFTPKLYVCWILHGIKWLCLETFLSTFFSLLFLASSFPQLQVGVWFVDQSLAAQNCVCCLRLRLETVGSLIYQKTKELICFRVESLFFNCSWR